MAATNTGVKGPQVHVDKSPQNVEAADVVNETSSIYGDTTNDRIDMLRLGKKQEFKRNFSFVSTLGFISIYMVSRTQCPTRR